MENVKKYSKDDISEISEIVIRAICAVKAGVTREKLKANQHGKGYVRPAKTMYIAKMKEISEDNNFGWSYSEISESLRANYKHSTAMHQQKNHKNFMFSDKQYMKDYECLGLLLQESLSLNQKVKFYLLEEIEDLLMENSIPTSEIFSEENIQYIRISSELLRKLLNEKLKNQNAPQ